MDGFKSGPSAHNYQTITGAAPATATRDLARLVELGALRRTGEHRHARYHLVLDKARSLVLLGGERDFHREMTRLQGISREPTADAKGGS